MPGREYVCAACGHHFRTPEGTSRDTRSLMCPGCGSYDLMICEAERAAPIVMRAKTPAPAGETWRGPKAKAS